jgi:hypothetical protein
MVEVEKRETEIFSITAMAGIAPLLLIQGGYLSIGFSIPGYLSFSDVSMIFTGFLLEYDLHTLHLQ